MILEELLFSSTIPAIFLVLQLYVNMDFIFLVRAHKLNIDVATMFNPETLATLEENKEQCDICLTRMSQTLNENLENAILSDEKQSAADETA